MNWLKNNYKEILEGLWEFVSSIFWYIVAFWIAVFFSVFLIKFLFYW